MTQRLALDLSEEWAALLHLEEDGWQLLGRTALTGDDLQARLTELLAKGHVAGGSPELLVSLPSDQMTYASLAQHEIDATLDDPTPALKSALSAKYPYLSDDMVVDWDLQSGWFLIAATARVVLQEASTFIGSCGMTPTAFTARPDPGQFPDQPVLGSLSVPGAETPVWPEMPDPAEMDVVEPPAMEPEELAAEDPETDPAPEETSASDATEEDPALSAKLTEVPSPRPTLRAVPKEAFAKTEANADKPQLIDDLEVTARHKEIEQRVSATARRHHLMPGRKFKIVAAMTGLLVIGLAALSFLPAQAPDMAEDPELILSEAVALDPAVPLNEETDPQPLPLSQTLDETEADNDPAAAEIDEQPVSEALPLPDDLTVFYSPSPILTQAVAEQDLLALVQPGIDPSFRTDALALPQLGTWGEDTLPKSAQAPGPAEQVFVVDERGLVRPSADGTMTPDGVLVFSGPPPSLPRPRPDRVEPEVVTVLRRADLPEDHPLKAVAPRARPQGFETRFERASLGGKTRAELATYRPKPRPVSAQEQTAEANAPATALALAQSPRPKKRSQQAVERFAKVAASTPADPIDRSQVSAPTAASPKNVARDATQGSGINLAKVNLLGTFGSSRSPRALVRMPSGQVVKVSVGDRMDGGRVSEIRQGRLSYVKSGRNVTLTMPSG